MAGSNNPRMQYRCSFCGKSQEQIHRMIAGPNGVYICNECIDLCNEIMGDSNSEASETARNVLARVRGSQITEEQAAQQEAQSAARLVLECLVARDYGHATTAAESLLERVRELQGPTTH